MISDLCEEVIRMIPCHAESLWLGTALTFLLTSGFVYRKTHALSSGGEKSTEKQKIIPKKRIKIMKPLAIRKKIGYNKEAMKKEGYSPRAKRDRGRCERSEEVVLSAFRASAMSRGRPPYRSGKRRSKCSVIWVATRSQFVPWREDWLFLLQIIYFIRRSRLCWTSNFFGKIPRP